MTPSKYEVERTIQVLEIDDLREREALRKFYARERAQDRAANKRLAWALFKFFLKIVLIAGVVALILVLS